MSIIGDRIRESRESQHMSKTDLAEATKLTLAAISQFESSDRDPNLESLNKLADALKVSVDYLMGRDEKISDINIQALFRGLQSVSESDKEEMVNFYQFLLAKSKFKKSKK